jgi:hypothetical protein
MTPDEVIGSLGVAILLIAYALNVRNIISPQARMYPALNCIGAGLACYASWLIDYYPFVVLEGVWMLVSLFALLQPRAPRRDAPVQSS